MNFPKDFLWGAATSSYQIEGASLEDGRGECIWHRFSHTPGKVANGEHGDVACDHYHRYKDDVALMQQLGLDSYRFSVSWPRVMPQGTGAANQAGLDFYSRLVDELLANDIRPFVTLYHWDLPQALQDKGGWGNRDVVNWFGEYTELMAKTLGDRVNDWITLNEPFVISMVGNFQGRHAPGNQDLALALKISHYLMLSHAQSVDVLREQVPGSQVGITLDYTHSEPASDDPRDADAARLFDAFHNRWFYDPVFLGSYPDDAVEMYGSALDGLDLDEVRAVPVEFVGVNYYTRNRMCWNSGSRLPFEQAYTDDIEHTEMKWEVYPDGLRQTLLRITEDYAPKAIYITENGAAFDDPTPINGVVDDPRRVNYLQTHLNAVSEAIDEGAPVKGYFVWSLLDNFEWAEGYSKRFGIIHVDFETQQRTLKKSAHYYRDTVGRMREGALT
jgi:beta-glucosidase